MRRYFEFLNSVLTKNQFVCLFRLQELMCIYSSLKTWQSSQVSKQRRRGGTKNWTVFDKTKRFFSYFYTIFQFTKFSTTRYIEFLNSVLTKNLETDSSFFWIFYFKFFKNLNFTDQFSINQSPQSPASFIGFHKNQPVLFQSMVWPLSPSLGHHLNYHYSKLALVTSYCCAILFLRNNYCCANCVLRMGIKHVWWQEISRFFSEVVSVHYIYDHLDNFKHHDINKSSCWRRILRRCPESC
jgi:hypothetical protein